MDRNAQRSCSARQRLLSCTSCPLAITLVASVILPLWLDWAASAADVPGRLRTVLDGDHVDIAAPRMEQALQLRLLGIDAPDEGQPFWQEARAFLEHLLAEKELKVATGRSPRLEAGGRTVATIVLPDGSTANRSLIIAGLAWVYDEDFRGDDTDREEFKILEEQARREKRGLWTDPAPVPPWLYRRLRAGAYP